MRTSINEYPKMFCYMLKLKTCVCSSSVLIWPLFPASCYSDCFGVLDCEWCMVDSDGKTLLDKPYCALQKECFGGIVGAKSPYADSLGLLGEWILNTKR